MPEMCLSMRRQRPNQFRKQQAAARVSRAMAGPRGTSKSDDDHRDRLREEHRGRLVDRMQELALLSNVGAASAEIIAWVWGAIAGIDPGRR
jgi:hypothetical protein